MTSEEETRTVSLQPQTQHKIHHLPAITYADKTSLLHNGVGDNAAATGTDRRRDTPDGITDTASQTPNTNAADLEDRLTHDANNFETPP